MRGLPSVSFRLLWILFVVVLVLALTVSCATTSSSPSPASSTSPSPSPSPTPSPTLSPTPCPTPNPTPSPTLSPSPTPSPTESQAILYQDDFSRPRPEMLVETGDSYDLDYQDGAYRIRLMESQVPVWVHIPGDWSDAVVQVDTKLQQGDAQAAYGVICRYQDEQHWYRFAISAEGSYSFFKIRGEEREDLITGFSAAIGFGQNALSVECRGDQFVVSINGEEVDYTWDSDYYAGGVGLFVRTFDTPQATVLFDNLKVLPLP